MASLQKTLADLHARHAREILEALAKASVRELQDAVASLRSPQRASKRDAGSKTSARTGHALEKLAADVVGHLKEHGALRSEDLRKALGVPRPDLTKALTLALRWKVIAKTGEKRATVYKARKTPGPKPQLALADRNRVAALVK